MIVLLLLTALLLAQAPSTQIRMGIVAGRVLTRNGSPAVGVTISALDASRVIGGTTSSTRPVRTADTNSDGRYRLSVPVGSYYIVAGRIDSPTYFPGVQAEIGATVISVSADANVSGIDFSVSPRSSGVTVSGRVILDARQPAASAPRSISMQRAYPIEQTTPIAPDGSFQFTKVPPGSYSLRLTPSPLEEVGTDQDPFRGFFYRVLVEDTDVRGIQWNVPLTLSIKGKIRLGGSAWRDGFGFSLDQAGRGSTYTRMPPEHNGEFTLTLHEGQYRVQVVGLPLQPQGQEKYRVSTLRYGAVDLLREWLILPAPTAAEMLIELQPVSARRPTTISQPAAFAPSPTNPANGIGMSFVKIEPGMFLMGCSPGDRECSEYENPAHIVNLTRGFEIGIYEVTQAQWRAVMGSNPSYFTGDDLPVEQVSWNDAEVFLTNMNARNDGYRYRLPTEAEWEYAARAGTTAPYNVTLGWHRDDSNDHTHPVGQRQPNAWGLYDMDGNVREWVRDRPGLYTADTVTDPQGPRTGARVLRGGAWDSMAKDLRLSSRAFSGASFAAPDIGIRCVRETVR